MSESLSKLIEQIGSVQPREEMQSGVRYRIHPLRSHVRYHVFLFRNTGAEEIPGLIKHFEGQFRSGWSWDNFSIVWDLSPVNPLKAIPEREWLVEGGAVVDPRHDEALSGWTATRYHPNGFTKQGR